MSCCNPRTLEVHTCKIVPQVAIPFGKTLLTEMRWGLAVNSEQDSKFRNEDTPKAPAVDLCALIINTTVLYKLLRYTRISYKIKADIL